MFQGIETVLIKVGSWLWFMAVMLRPNLIQQTVFLLGDAVIGTVLLDGIGMILMDNSIKINVLTQSLFAIGIL